MAIAFCNLISEDFYKERHNSFDLDEKIDVCIDNIHEFLSIIWTFHGIRKCNLERYQVECYSKYLRRSNHFFRKNFIDLCWKYPIGFRDCVSVVENIFFLMLPRINSNKTKKKKEHSIKQINKDINKLSSFTETWRVLEISRLLPSKRCENVDCSNCLFIINLRYLYV